MSHEVVSTELPEAPPSEKEAGALVNIEALSGPVVAELGNNAVRAAQLVENLGQEATEAYFHGSNYPFRMGQEVIPGAYAVIDNNGVEQASATTDERTAWSYAQDKENLYGGRGRVFKVVPSGGESAQGLGPQQGEVNSRRFKVVDEINIKPGRQGTFPEVNWAKYTPYEGANHPEDPPYEPESDWKPYEGPAPNDVPIPELGEEYVRAELEGMRIASGRPLL